MIDFKTKINRNYGYDILINNFEPFLRRYLCDKVFLINYANDWRKYIPQGVINDLHENKDIQDIDNMSIMDFFEELNFLNLKDIIIAFNNYRLLKIFFGRVK